MNPTFGPEPKIKNDFTKASISLVETWLEKAWAKEFVDDEKLQVSLMRNREDLRSLNVDQNGVRYPHARMVITNIEVDSNKAGMAKRALPIVAARSANSDFVTIGNHVPVKIGLGMSFVTDNLDQLLNFAHLMVFAAPRVRLSMRNDSGFVWHCSLNIDPNMSIPEADMGYVAKTYNFETSLILDTWLIRERAQGVIRNVVLEVIDSGGVSTEIGTYPTLDTLIERTTSYTDIVDANHPRYHRSKS